MTPTLDELFSEHHDRVFSAAYRVTGNPQDAEDIVQTVFLRLLSRHEMPTASHQLAAYLRRAAVNQAIDLLRARKRAPLDELDESAHCDPSTDIETTSTQSELQEQLRAAMLQLEPGMAEIFALRYFEGYGNSDIAQILDSTPNSVAVSLHRVRARLQDILSELSGEDR